MGTPTPAFTRKVDGKEFRDYINDIAGKESENIYYLDGFDDAIIGFVDTENDLVPHIVYDYWMMVGIAKDQEAQEDYNKDATSEEIWSCAVDRVEDALRSIAYRNGLPSKAKVPIVLHPIVDTFVTGEGEVTP